MCPPGQEAATLNTHWLFQKMCIAQHTCCRCVSESVCVLASTCVYVSVETFSTWCNTEVKYEIEFSISVSWFVNFHFFFQKMCVVNLLKAESEIRIASGNTQMWFGFSSLWYTNMHTDRHTILWKSWQESCHISSVFPQPVIRQTVKGVSYVVVCHSTTCGAQ